MPNAIQVFDPGFRVTDTSGDPVSGAKIRFFEAGTSTPKTVYSDSDLSVSLGSVVYTRSDGFPVSEQGGNTTVNVYVGTGRYKLDILDADDVTIWPSKDNIEGAVAITDEGTPETTIPVETITGTETIDATDNGKLIRGNSSGGSVTCNLAAAATLGDGWHAYFQKTAAANSMTLDAAGSDLINGSGTLVLADQYDFVHLTCDGAGFHAFYGASMARQDASAVAITGGSVTGITDLAVADGGTGASTAADARTALGVAYASQANMEALAATAVVIPSVQHFQPMHPKAGGVMNGTGTPAYGRDTGMGAITDNNTGDYTLAFDTSFSDTNYWFAGTARGASGANVSTVSMDTGDTKAAGSFQIAVVGGDHATRVDSAEIGFTFWGDYA